MRPRPGGLPWVAMGLAVLLLTVPVHGYDVLADPLGWVLIGFGASLLDLGHPERSRLRALVWLAGLLALAVWPAPAATRLSEADPSLAWAASLPGIGVAVVLCGALATAARHTGDPSAARWWEINRTLTLVAGALPVLVFGGHLSALDTAAEVVSVAAPGLLLVLAVRYRNRPWAAPAEGVPTHEEV